MNHIGKRIAKLKPYVVGIRFLDEDMVAVDTMFADGWTVPKSDRVEFSKTEGSENYHMFYGFDGTVEVDEILDFVEKAIQHNIEREKKYELLRQKVGELEVLFRKTPLRRLQGLKFVLPEENVITKMEDKIATNRFNLEDDAEDEVPFAETVQPQPKAAPLVEPMADKVLDEVEKFNSANSSRAGKIELPPKKGEKVELEDFAPVAMVCKCVGDAVCPVCMDDKY